MRTEMAVNALRYEHAGQIRWGLLVGNTVRPIVGDHPTTGAFLSNVAIGDPFAEHHLEPPVPLADIRVLSPITSNQQYICQAVNYHSHLSESGLSPETSPFNVFFRKASSSISAADTDIVCPAHVEFLDYEVEVGLVMGSAVDGPVEVTADNLSEHVAALVALNDVSGRDVQLGEGQFYKAKSYRTFGPTGPYLTLVDADDLARFDELRLRLSVNGQTRQDAYASEMVHQPAPTLTELSSVQDWAPGDLLATGTPGGCALQAPALPLRVLAQAVSPKRRQQLVRKSAERNEHCLRIGDQIAVGIATDDGAIDLGRQSATVVAA
ncbi:MAG: fumarylacetoacetate hydrolase family protein [Actinomycetota bacterium]